MRTLLVLLTVVLISGCAGPQTLAEKKASCLALQKPGVNTVWVDAQRRCRYASTTSRSATAGTTHHIAEPIIDKGAESFDGTQYAKDLSACRGYANQVASQTLDNALGGLLLGAAFGAIIDNNYNTSGGARTGAMTGALGGGVQGAASTHQGRALVLRKCLAGRGYSVLDW